MRIRWFRFRFREAKKRHTRNDQSTPQHIMIHIPMPAFKLYDAFERRWEAANRVFSHSTSCLCPYNLRQPACVITHDAQLDACSHIWWIYGQLDLAKITSLAISCLWWKWTIFAPAQCHRMAQWDTADWDWVRVVELVRQSAGAPRVRWSAHNPPSYSSPINTLEQLD